MVATVMMRKCDVDRLTLSKLFPWRRRRNPFREQTECVTQENV